MSYYQPEGKELEDILDAINRLDEELLQIEDSISKETRKEKRRLAEEHENWAPLILDTQARLAQGDATTEELQSLEKEENEARLAIRREFQQRATEMTHRKEAIRLELGRLQRRLSPSITLPEDGLMEVFEQFILKNGGSPWILAQVCRLWRRIVMQTTHLWSGICISTSLDAELTRRYDGKEVCNSMPRLKRALERVGDAPIDLAIMLNWSHTSVDESTANSMIVTISRYSQQWRTLHLENSEQVIQGTHAFPEDLFGNGLPLLQHVSFHMEHFNTTIHSLGLLPFSDLLHAIENTSNNLRSVHFHGYGRNELTNSNYRSTIPINDLALIPADPRSIWLAFDNYLRVKPAVTRVSRRYAPFVSKFRPLISGLRLEHTLESLPVNRRLAIYPSIAEGLHASHLADLQILDIVSHNGLNLTEKLNLPRVWQLSIYSNDLDGLHHFNAYNLENLRVMLLPSESYDTRESLVALQELWDKRRPKLKEVQLIEVCVDYRLLSSITRAGDQLKKVILRDVTFEGIDSLSGLAANSASSTNFSRLEVIYTDMVGPTRATYLANELQQLVVQRKLLGHGLKQVILQNGPEEEKFE